jgi:hypothetical protein
MVNSMGCKGIPVFQTMSVSVGLKNGQQAALSPAGVGELRGAQLLCREKGWELHRWVS